MAPARLPDVPTPQEAGFKGYNLINGFGLRLPAGAAPDVTARKMKATK